MNAAFAAASMDTTVESLLQSGMDFSPGATAQRIVDFSTSCFSSYQRNHAEQDGQTQMAGFAEMIKGAIEEGFASAQIFSRVWERSLQTFRWGLTRLSD